MEKEYIICQNKLEKYINQAEKIYHLAVILNYFCSGQQEIEELRNLTPGLQYIVKNADNLYCDLFNLLLEKEENF